MPKGKRSVGFVELAMLLLSVACVVSMIHMHMKLTSMAGDIAMMRAGSFEEGAHSPKPTGAQGQPPARAAHPVPSGTSRADDPERRLAMLNMVDWDSATVGSGCVRVDVSSSNITLPLNTKACNGHACPPCFGLNTTPGLILHTATFTGCGEMYVSSAHQLGFGVFQTALQQIEFVNLNSRYPVAISDGQRTFLIPPGMKILGSCLVGTSGEIHLDMQLQKYFTPGSTFSLITGAAAWSVRQHHAAVVRTDGVVLVLGGSGSKLFNDVYSSADGGTTWAQLTGDALSDPPAWTQRMGHAAVVRPDGAVLVLGGYTSTGYKKDVYCSADGGATWVQLTGAAAWDTRAHHAAVVRVDGAVLVLGGMGGAATWYHSDVYSSADGGATWVQLTGAATWGPRLKHAAVVRTDGAVLVLGGTANGLDALSDVYSSSDGGATWTQLTAAAAWGARFDHAAVVRADGAVLVLGGRPDIPLPPLPNPPPPPRRLQSSASFYSDVYGSADGGATWAQLAGAAAWSERCGHTAVVRADGAVLVLGGFGANGNHYNDVYSSEG